MNKPLSRSLRSRRRLERWLGREEGQGQIEFVLSILTIMFTIFWTWEVVLAVYTYNVLSDAAKEGVRYAIVHGSNNVYCSGPGPSGGCPAAASGATAPNLCDGSAATAPPDANASTQTTTASSPGNNVARTVVCYAQLSLHDIKESSGQGSMSIRVDYPQGTNAAGSLVNVTVSYKYAPFLALPITPTLQTAASGRIVN